MQNKPNFPDAKMNVTSTQITSYHLPFTNYQYAKQTQFQKGPNERNLDPNNQLPFTNGMKIRDKSF